MVSPGSLRHLSSLTHRCWPAELQHGHSPSVLSVMNSLPQKTYLSRNTSHKVSFSCHCYISDTQQDSPDAHRQSVEMLRPLIHRNRKRKKMWKWVFGLHKRANWTNLMSEDASALTSVLPFVLSSALCWKSCRYVLGSLQTAKRKSVFCHFVLDLLEKQAPRRVKEDHSRLCNVNLWWINAAPEDHESTHGNIWHLIQLWRIIIGYIYMFIYKRRDMLAVQL